MQCVEFPDALRHHLADLALAHERGELDGLAYEAAKADAIAVTEAQYRADGRLTGDGWSAKRSPPVRHYPNGRYGCWWKGITALDYADHTQPIRSVQVVEAA